MNSLSTKKFAFILGREIELCFRELEAVLQRLDFDYTIINVAKNNVFINIDNTDNTSVAELINILGGTIKIFELVGDRSNNLEKDLKKVISDDCAEMDRIEFGISSYDFGVPASRVNLIGLSIKKSLKKSKSVRFVAISQGFEIAPVVSLKQGLIKKGIELAIFPRAIGKLIAVSNIEDWSSRDYEKPKGDKRSGMLPPKLARIMLNLALSELPNSRNSNDILVLDPFCGSGNMLIESMLLGVDFLGTDLSAKAVEDSIDNCQWIKEKYSVVNLNYKIEMADATSFNFFENIKRYSEFSKKNSIAIVCEPYLGEPKKFKPTMNAAKGEYVKVKEMYLGFLNNFLQFRTQNSGLKTVLCIVFPYVETLDKGMYSLYDECVDEIQKMGYTELQSPLIYGRDYQVVKREIALLTLE